jgi:hypothetical protein
MIVHSGASAMASFEPVGWGQRMADDGDAEIKEYVQAVR